MSTTPYYHLPVGPPRAPWFVGDDYEEFLDQQSRLRFVTLSPCASTRVSEGTR